MPKKSAPVKIIISLGALALIAYLVISSIRATQLKYEVCMDFKGGTHCADATGATSEDAIRSAHEIDCSLLATGRDELMVCMDQAPARITPLK